MACISRRRAKRRVRPFRLNMTATGKGTVALAWPNHQESGVGPSLTPRGLRRPGLGPPCPAGGHESPQPFHDRGWLGDHMRRGSTTIMEIPVSARPITRLRSRSADHNRHGVLPGSPAARKRAVLTAHLGRRILIRTRSVNREPASGKASLSFFMNESRLERDLTHKDI
jgi:hypothetical protein